MKSFSFEDETLDINRTNSYGISIQVALNGFSFSILDLVRDKFIVLTHHDLSHKNSFEEKAEEIKQITDKNPLLQSSFKKKKILVINPKSVLIPAPLFDQNYVKKYFEFNHKLEELEEIHYQEDNAIDAFNIFTLPNPVSNELIQAFGKTSFHHQFSPFNMHHINIHNENRFVGVYIYEHFIDIGLFANHQLKFYNSFLIQSKEDILYFILYTFKQFNLSRSVNELYLSGDTGIFDGLEHLLKQYIKKIHQQKPPKDFTYSYTFSKSALQYFSNLFRLELCE